MWGILLLSAYALFLFSINIYLVNFLNATNPLIKILTHLTLVIISLVCMFLFTLTVAKTQMFKILFNIQPTPPPCNPVSDTSTQHIKATIDDNNDIDIEIEYNTSHTGPKLDTQGCYVMDGKCGDEESATIAYLVTFLVILLILVGLVIAFKMGYIFKNS